MKGSSFLPVPRLAAEVLGLSCILDEERIWTESWCCTRGHLDDHDPTEFLHLLAKIEE